MNTKQAVAERIIELCKERNIALNTLANVSGVAPSTVYSMLNEKSQNPFGCFAQIYLFRKRLFLSCAVAENV